MKKVGDQLDNVEWVGDVNGDGFDDFIFSSSYNWCDGMGRVYLFLGGDTLDSKPKLTFMTNQLEDLFGRSGAGGDVNGDGYDDIIVGAPAEATDQQGEVYIYTTQPLSSVSNSTKNMESMDFSLIQNYPNPFNSATTLSYDLLLSCHVTLGILNSAGEKIITLVSGYQTPGKYHIVWDGKDKYGKLVSSGVYFCKMNVESISLQNKNAAFRKFLFLK